MSKDATHDDDVSTYRRWAKRARTSSMLRALQRASDAVGCSMEDMRRGLHRIAMVRR